MIDQYGGVRHEVGGMRNTRLFNVRQDLIYYKNLRTAIVTNFAGKWELRHRVPVNIFLIS